MPKNQHRSITQRLRRAKSPEAKRAALLDWAASWQTEQTGLIKDLGRAIADDDFDSACIAVGELKAMSDKKFSALPNVLTTLLNNPENEEGGNG